jgi:peptidoglycan/xylan/chitin deacetylase (PgdA/CDA1 family)
LWNVDPSDYLRPSPYTLTARVLSKANGQGLIVALHDGGGSRSNTVAALPSIIQGLKARGYVFVKLCN